VAMVCLLAAPWVQLSVSAGNGWPHNALRHHWLTPISCHFRDCKALLVTSLTHVSGAIASVQTFTFTFNVILVFDHSLSAQLQTETYRLRSDFLAQCLLLTKTSSSTRKHHQQAFWSMRFIHNHFTRCLSSAVNATAATTLSLDIFLTLMVEILTDYLFSTILKQHSLRYIYEIFI